MAAGPTLNALLTDKREGTAAFTGLEYCNKLFAWEDRFKELSPEVRTKQRLKEEKPISDALLAWAERSIKPFVIGRKNFLFANTPLGAQASAVIYSLIETAKETRLDPFRYLAWVLQTAPTLDRTVEGWAQPLLPTEVPEDLQVP